MNVHVHINLRLDIKIYHQQSSGQSKVNPIQSLPRPVPVDIIGVAFVSGAKIDESSLTAIQKAAYSRDEHQNAHGNGGQHDFDRKLACILHLFFDANEGRRAAMAVNGHMICHVSH